MVNYKKLSLLDVSFRFTYCRYLKETEETSVLCVVFGVTCSQQNYTPVNVVACFSVDKYILFIESTSGLFHVAVNLNAVYQVFLNCSVKKRYKQTYFLQGLIYLVVYGI